MKLDLAKIILDSKTMTFDHPQFEGFSITLTYNSKTRLTEMRKDCMETKYDASLGYPTQRLDMNKWNEVFCREVITGWKGFKAEFLAKMILIDESQVDLNEEVDYSVETAVILLSNSPAFDSWVNSCLADLNNFRK